MNLTSVCGASILSPPRLASPRAWLCSAGQAGEGDLNEYIDYRQGFQEKVIFTEDNRDG